MIYIVGIGPGGSADYLSGRALTVVSLVDQAIYRGEMIGPEIRNLFAPGKLKVGRFAMDEVMADLEQAVTANRNLAILVPGDPSLYSGQDGQEKTVGQYLTWLRARGAAHEVVPGISSWMALCAKAGLDMTEFGSSQSVVVVSLERMATVGVSPNIDWEAIGEACRHKPTLVLFQSYAHRKELPAQLLRHYAPMSEVIIGFKVSWPEEKIVRMSLEAYAQDQLGAELAKHSIIIILPV